MMDAVKFIVEKDRMCASLGGVCGRCEIKKHMGVYDACGGYTVAHPREVVEIVEKWSKEHPKTRQGWFLKIFPDADIAEDGHPRVEPCCLGTQCTHEARRAEHCLDCREQFWNEEVE